MGYYCNADFPFGNIVAVQLFLMDLFHANLYFIGEKERGDTSLFSHYRYRTQGSSEFTTHWVSNETNWAPLLCKLSLLNSIISFKCFWLQSTTEHLVFKLWKDFRVSKLADAVKILIVTFKVTYKAFPLTISLSRVKFLLSYFLELGAVFSCFFLQNLII